jgi:hypothetical protein
MDRDFILLSIQRVFIVSNFWNHHQLMVSELNRSMSGIACQFGYRLIPLKESQYQTQFMVRSNDDSNRPLSSYSEPASFFSLKRKKGFVEGHYFWKTGSGFTATIKSKNVSGTLSPDVIPFIQQNRVVEKYLEFLSRFNHAYEDDFILNFSVSIPVESPDCV